MYEIQSWLSGLPDCASLQAPSIGLSSMPRTPSPTKRRRLESTGDDDYDNNNTDEARNDTTPRPKLPPIKHSSSSRDNTSSSDADNQPFSAQEYDSVSRTSSRSTRIQALAEQLADLESKQGILPGCLRSTIQAYRSPSEPIRDYMFDNRHDGQGSDIEMRNMDRELERLLEIRDNTQECNSRARVFHEVEWNETAHSPMLRLVTKRIATLACRNLTQTSLSPRWATPEFQDSRIDYGIFVAPDPDTDLYCRIFTYIQQRQDATRTELGQINPLTDIDIDRPLAIAVETKRLAPGVEKANTQLASFGRSMLRFQHDVATFLADTRIRPPLSETNGSDHAFVLPLLTVIGPVWEVDFMVREKGLAVIYGPVPVGSTQTLTNCYRLYRSLDILFQWAHQHCVEWWTAMLQTT
ncbi:hypothetical protein CIB48_g11580 [Xylaria polymorpha]|nr:hypothetical protein CIB48_g11580 [Xylaria polymorpha]